MKNLKGCLKREDKPKFHRKNLESAILELNRIVRPDLNLIDGTISAGKDPGVIVASEDIVAADAVSCSIMGFDTEQITTVAQGFLAGLGEKNLANLEVRGKVLRKTNLRFEPPYEKLRREFPYLSIESLNRSCSGCVITIFDVLSNLRGSRAKLNKALLILTGKSSRVEKGLASMSVGDYARRSQGQGNHVPECPPKEEEIEFMLRTLMYEYQDGSTEEVPSCRNG